MWRGIVKALWCKWSVVTLLWRLRPLSPHHGLALPPPNPPVPSSPPHERGIFSVPHHRHLLLSTSPYVLCTCGISFPVCEFASLRLRLASLVPMCLNNSSHSPHTFPPLSPSLSLYHRRRRSPASTASLSLSLSLLLSQWCDGPHCGPLVVLHEVLISVWTPRKSLSFFRTSVGRVWSSVKETRSNI